MPISHWPRQERPREKLQSRGAETLSDAELLAIFLRSGVKGKSAVDLARELLIKKGGLRKLLESQASDLCKQPGIGMAKSVLLQATLELGKRYLQAGLEQREVLSDPDTTRDYLLSELRAQQHEIFACLFLNNRHHIISFDKMFNGTIDNASVYPREIVKRALAHNAAAVIFAHNHPSGIAEPSQADIALTLRLKAALELVDVRVLDHFIIGHNGASSLAEQGLI